MQFDPEEIRETYARYVVTRTRADILPPDLELARREFMLLLDQYPDNSKAPDAMYKLGKVYFEKGNREKAREYLDRVISEFGSSNSSAVKLARDFLRQNY